MVTRFDRLWETKSRGEEDEPGRGGLRASSGGPTGISKEGIVLEMAMGSGSGFDEGRILGPSPIASGAGCADRRLGSWGSAGLRAGWRGFLRLQNLDKFQTYIFLRKLVLSLVLAQYMQTYLTLISIIIITCTI